MHMRTHTPVVGRLQTAKATESLQHLAPPARENAMDDDAIQRIEEHLGPVAYKMVNEKGQVDLRKLTGDEALTYFAALGIPIGRI